MAEETDFCLLGPLLVRSGGVVVPVRRGKQRAVLAALLLSVGKVVSLDELAEILWGPEPPPSARVTIQNYVMRLRQALGDAGGSRIRTQPPGYLIRVDPGELDVTRFESQLAAAQEAARDRSWDTAAARSRAALSLWRGEPVSDVDSEVLAAREVPRLVELRLQALEVRIEAALRLGRPGAVIGELRRLVACDPLRERFSALLMAALYEDGRQAEALAVYQQARAALVAELGVEPGRELRDLHQRILAAGQVLPSLASPAAMPAAPANAGAPAPQPPRQLPAAVGCFTGRAGELAALTGLLDARPGAAAATMVISAIGGTAGVGKTALAIEWAHQIATRFPDGQLYVNLCGYDPGQPVAAAEALAGFLRTLGVPGREIPDETEDRARLYRSRLAGRRVLVLLDNARDGDQVRPLLPGDPCCAAVVTSRDAMAGLVARDGARRLDLDLLPLGDAVALLRSLIGTRADDDPGAVAELAALCAQLPLALRIAAELAARRPTPLAELVAELAARRLECLDAGEDRADVRAVFSWSYRQLPDAAAGAFALLGLHPGADLDVHAAAALTGTTSGEVGPMLGQLHRASLLQAAGPGRYGMHDLLRAYAREQAVARDTGGQCQQALTRLFDHYLATAASATEAVYPGRRRQPGVSSAVTPAPPLDDPACARQWLDSNRACLVASAIYCAEHGWPGHAARLAGTLFPYFHVGGYYPEASSVCGAVLLAARQGGDHATEAEALTGLGIIDFEQGRYTQAAGRYVRALNLSRESGDRDGELRALHNLGGVDMYQGRCAQAAERARQAAALYRQSGNKTGEALALNNLGFAGLRRGLYEQAAGHLRQALELYRDSGDLSGEARALANLGVIQTRQGRYLDAGRRLRRALELSRQSGSKAVEAYALASAGYLDVLQTRYQEAGERYDQALAIYRQCGERSGEAEALNGLGEVLLGTGRPGRSRDTHLAALALASRTGDLYQQARAHHGLARVYQATIGHEQARRHWRHALALYSGFPEAGQVRAELAATGHDGRPHS